MTERLDRPQISCHLLHTTPRVRDLVHERIAESPLYNGQIRGIGPRYCPSLEDKIMRFPDREAHQVFLEPEGLDVPEIYVNGFSTSLPRETQLALVRALPGLEHAEMLRPGYAVEYDFVQPTELRRSLECKRIPGYFSPARSMGHPATRKRAPRASSLARTPRWRTMDAIRWCSAATKATSASSSTT